jgi:fengycin family lipopeptide synthetase B
LHAEDTRALTVPGELTFNYLGQIGRDQVAAVSSGQAVGPLNYATSAISVDGLMYGERLRLNFSFDALRFARSDIEKLAQDCLTELQGLIDHCQGKRDRVYTASDLGDTTLSAEEIDEILA